MEVSGYDEQKVIWELVDNNVVEKPNNNDTI